MEILFTATVDFPARNQAFPSKYSFNVEILELKESGDIRMYFFAPALRAVVARDHHLAVRLGPYEVVAEIGRGGAGAVLRALAPDGRVVAIKLLLRPDARGALARFDRERRLLASLGESSGFVPLLDAGDSAAGPYLVMPFLEGGTLADRLRRGPLALDEAIDTARALATALGEAHEDGIVHRDLKPANVLYTARGEPLVADLGLAKHFVPDASAGASLSKSGDFRGTVGYMAPEQMGGAKEAGPPADVFALGAILYECLAGQPAFRGATASDVVAAVVWGNREPLRALRPDTPRWLTAIVDRAMAIDPDRRFADAGAFARAIDEGPRRSAARNATIAFGAIALVAIAIASTFAIGRGGSAPARSPSSSPSPSPSTPRSPSPSPSASVTLAPLGAQSDLPAACASFSRTAHARLVGVWGRTEWKSNFMLGALALTPDGTRAVTAGLNGMLCVWDPARGELLHPLEGLSGPAFPQLALSPDGKVVLASMSTSDIVRLADVEGGRTLLELSVETGVHSLAVSRAPSAAVLIGGKDGSVALWDAGHKKRLRTFATRNFPSVVALSPDGKRAAYGGGNRERQDPSELGIEICDATTGAPIRTLEGTGAAVTWLGFLPGGELLLAATQDGALRLWDPATGRLVRTFAGQGSAILAANISKDGTRAIVGFENGKLELVELASEAEPATFPTHESAVVGVAFMPDGRRALTAGADQTLRVWDVVERRATSAIAGHQGRVSSVAVTPDGLRAVSVSSDCTLRLWEVATGRELGVLEGHAFEIEGVVVLPSGRSAVTVSRDRLLAFWDLERKKSTRTLAGHTGRLFAVARSADGRRLASAGDDGVRIWDLERSVPEVAKIDAGEKGACSVALSPDGRRVLVGGTAGELALWDASPGGRLELMLPSHPRGVMSLAFSPDGRRAVSGGADGEVHVIDLASKRTLQRLRGHGAMVYAVAFDAAGHRVLSGAQDGTIRIWDVETGAEIDRIDLVSTFDAALALAVSADGRWFLAGTARGVVLRFELL